MSTRPVLPAILVAAERIGAEVPGLDRIWFDQREACGLQLAARAACAGRRADVRVCVPVTADGQVDPRWGRAERVAVADVADGEIRGWHEFTVGWGTLHDQGTEGAHHARVARFLLDNQVEAIAVHHVGPGMQRMLGSMAVRVVAGLGGDARAAARAVE